MAVPTKFSTTQIVLHWTIALMVLFQYLMHDGIESAWEKRMDGTIENVAFPNPHAIVGILILLLVIFRLIVRMKHGVPALPASELPFVGLIAKGTHHLFYLLLIGMPLSGAAAWFLGIEVPANMHGLASKIMIALIALHIGAALLHHFVLKTNVLKRMLGINS